MAKYRKLLILTLFGIAFGFVEAAVVVYLRELYYPAGFKLSASIPFPFIKFGVVPELQPMPLRILLVELGREAATIIMLLSIALASGKGWREKLAFFLWPFAVWDIFYYVFLKIILGWPSSLSTVDLLFLIPVPWLAPVWMPLCASTLMLLIAWWLVRAKQQGR